MANRAESYQPDARRVAAAHLSSGAAGEGAEGAEIKRFAMLATRKASG